MFLEIREMQLDAIIAEYTVMRRLFFTPMEMSMAAGRTIWKKLPPKILGNCGYSRNEG